MAAPAASVSVLQLIAFTTTAALLFLTDLQGHPFLAHASGENRVSTLHVQNQHAAGRNSKLGAVEENFGVSSRSWRSNTRTNLPAGRSELTRRNLVTSYNGPMNTSTGRLEVEALTAFKAAITSDPLGALKSWRANDSDACDWSGVICSSPQQGPQHLIALDLGGAQLVGNLNSALQELGHLSFLQHLDLSTNVFSGSIPAASVSNCSHLSYLNASGNQLSGAIPPELGGLDNLQVLDLQGNNLTGQIPVSLCNCTLLRVLDLGSNYLRGTIPPLLGRLSNLEFLNVGTSVPPGLDFVIPVGTNSLSGSIPRSLGNCSLLTHLDLTLNSDLTGELPPEMSRLENLQQLALSSCSFQGAFPIWVGNLTALTQLDLSYNKFVGVIPDVMGQLGDLNAFILGGNNFSGAIPMSITNCSLLTTLTVELNGLTGDIPPQLGFLRELSTLHLADNLFSGVIPSSLRNCSALATLELGDNPLLDPQTMPSWIGSFANLYYLYLGNMNLFGEIPAEVGELSNLQYLLLYGNNLTGQIPTDIGKLSYLNSLDVFGNNLTGPIPNLANCTVLTYLECSENELTGEIPIEIGQLTSLTWVGLGPNFLTGSISTLSNLTQIEVISVPGNSFDGILDRNFGTLLQLQQLLLDSNKLSGPLLETLSNCSNLYFVDMADNDFSGEIPPSWGNMTDLEQLYLGGNPIEGRIPVDICKCSSLGSLHLEAMNLTGNVPSNIGQLQSLQSLSLDYNNFDGIVPTSLGNCSKMIFLDLSHNQFIGSIPGDVVSKMSSSLTTLNLSHNLFSGSLPPVLSDLANLQIMDVSSNNISGPLPAGLDRCTALVSLDISFNHLTGEIPQSLGLLPALQFFNASYNSFDGPIPQSGVFKANLTEDSFLGNPGLCGAMLGPHHECPVAPPPANHNGTSYKACVGFKCKRVWIPTTTAILGVALIVAGALCWVGQENRIRRNNKNKRCLLLNFSSHMRISEDDVRRTIRGDCENVIGVGNNSVVYKGVLPGGETFALKMLPKYEDSEDEEGRRQGESELLKEVHILAKLRHRNILKVLSFCSTSDVKAMILEYMPEGSLQKHLFELPEDTSCELTWQVRFNIAVGVAEAMMYLHQDFPEPLIHRDLKPSNILLDANFDPKVSDFGISKFANPTRDGEASASSTVCGTIGYMPPEYAMGISASTKGDVYSYGVVLLEMLTRQSANSWDRLGASGDLKDWVMESFEEKPLEVLDPILKREGTVNLIKKEQMMLLMRVALFCMRETPQNRPSMSDVLAMLMQIKEVGLKPITPRTMEDLVNEATMWTSEDPDDASLTSF